MISAKIIADSVAEHGGRITTFVLEYPRFIHAELMTHREFSRNASSSRAIPVQKMLERVKKDPALPIHWGKNQAGMQASEELGLTTKALCLANWLALRDRAVETVEALHQLGLHKQAANRLLEPWMHISVVCTSTQPGLNNFFNLRYHKAAQPEMQVLAQKMFEAQALSFPKVLSVGQWHLPYVTDEDFGGPVLTGNHFQKISAARCARVSYLNHDGKVPELGEDLDLFERLMGGFPKHASPTEHQATPSTDPDYRSGNFKGWLQFRKSISGEYLTNFEGPTP